MDVGFWEEFVCGLNKSIDKLIVLFPLDTGLLEAKVEIIFEELFVLNIGKNDGLQDSKGGLNEHTSVPQSSTTGNVRAGWIPAESVARTSFATEMRMPPTPASGPISLFRPVSR